MDVKITRPVKPYFSDPEIEAIFVLTALEAHHKYVMMALEAGKHVFVEKTGRCQSPRNQRHAILG